MTAEVSEGSVQSGPLPVSQHSRQRGEKKNPNLRGTISHSPVPAPLVYSLHHPQICNKFPLGSSGERSQSHFQCPLHISGLSCGNSRPCCRGRRPVPSPEDFDSHSYDRCCEELHLNMVTNNQAPLRMNDEVHHCATTVAGARMKFSNCSKVPRQTSAAVFSQPPLLGQTSSPPRAKLEPASEGQREPCVTPRLVMLPPTDPSLLCCPPPLIF